MDKTQHEAVQELTQGYLEDKESSQHFYLNHVDMLHRLACKGEISWDKFLKALNYSSAAHLMALKITKDTRNENRKNNNNSSSCL